MPDTYAFKGRGNQHAYDAFGFHVERQTLDFGKVLAGDQALVNPNTGLDAIPTAVTPEDVYQIFNVKTGFMTYVGGFAIINKAPTDFLEGSVLFFGVAGAIVNNPGGVADDPTFWAILDPSLGNVIYPSVSGEGGAYANSAMNGYLALETSTLDFSVGGFGEGAEADLDDAVIEFFMFGSQMLDRELSDATADLVWPVQL